MATTTPTTTPVDARELGKRALRRGLLSREELAATHAQARQQPGHGEGWRRDLEAFVDALIRGRYLDAALLDELLHEGEPDAESTARAPAASDLQEALPPPEGAALEQYLFFGLCCNADEVVLATDRRPAVRRARRLLPLEAPPLSEARVRDLAAAAFTEAEVDAVDEGACAVTTQRWSCGRFRIVLTPSHQGLSLTARPLQRALGPHAPALPPEVMALADLHQGLVILAGQDPPLRRRALAQLVDHINRTSHRHTIVIERATSYEHHSAGGLVALREVGPHTASFDSALRATLREDPDVIAIGDLDEPQAVATALIAAETGHLVLCSLHAPDAAYALSAILDGQGFAARDLVRTTLANSLQAVAVLHTIPGRRGREFVVADLVPGTPPVTRLIRESRVYQLGSAAGGSAGMTSRDRDILSLYRQGRVSRTVALERLDDPDAIAAVDERTH